MKYNHQFLKQFRNILIFIILFTVIWSGLTGILVRKTRQRVISRMNWEEFYDMQSDSLDVLVAGSSHAFINFDTYTFSKYSDQEIYVMGTAGQDIIQTYYSLKEAFKYQAPKLVIVEVGAVYLLNPPITSSTYETRIRSFDSMRPSINKLILFTKLFRHDEWINTLFPLVREHSNWMYKDVLYNNITNKMAFSFKSYRGHIAHNTVFDKSKIDEYGKFEVSTEEICDVNIEMLQKIIELCNENDSEIVLIMAPWLSSFTQQLDYEKIHSQIEEVSNENGVLYYDYNNIYNEVGFNYEHFANDPVGINQHLNFCGSYYLTIDIMKQLITKGLIQVNQDIWTNRNEDEDLILLKKFYFDSTN